MTKILHLNIKRKWFDMILSGEKKEEYREIKPYWTSRLKWRYVEYLDNTGETITTGFHNFNIIIFKNGYGKNTPTFIIECKGIKVSYGNEKWGAKGIELYYTIKLGKILGQTNN